MLPVFLGLIYVFACALVKQYPGEVARALVKQYPGEVARALVKQYPGEVALALVKQYPGGVAVVCSIYTRLTMCFDEIREVKFLSIFVVDSAFFV